MISVRCFFDRFFRFSLCTRHFILWIIAFPMALLIAGSVAAQQGYYLVGGWEHTKPMTQNSPAFTMTQFFNQNGTFNFQEMIAPRPGMAGTIVKYWGSYRVTGESSIVYRPENFQMCASGGGCLTCPGDPQACKMARQSGAEPGVQYPSSFQIEGQNKFTDQSGMTWWRTR